MHVRKPRSRVIYFRVSEDEFAAFTRACESEGVRSLSDLAREAMRRRVSDQPREDDPVVNSLQRLELLIGQVSARLQHLEIVTQESNPGRKDAESKIMRERE